MHKNKINTSDIKVLFSDCENEEDVREKVFHLYLENQKIVNFAIDKAFKKFKHIPLEKDDFKSLSWTTFYESCIKYTNSNIKKNFPSFIIDSLYWKSLDYCLKFINNRHKLLNVSSSIESDFKYVESININDFHDFSLNTRTLLNQFFDTKVLEKQMFTEFICGATKQEIQVKYKISSRKLNNFLEKTINQLSVLFE